MFRRWLTRHRNPTNFLLHMVGIPATVAALPLAVMRHWLLAAGLFAAGYALQFLGHAVEGSPSGEGALLGRLVRRRRPRRPPEQ